MDHIDRYLDELAGRLRLGPARTRRFLAEVEDHLREASAREEAAGADPELAARRAVERFGTPGEVAAAANGPVLARVGPLALGAAQLGAVGSAAVLAGTLLARLVALATSTTSAFGLPPGYLPSSTRASHWLAVQPGAADWHAAAASENADDTLLLRGGFAVACLVVSLVAVRVLGRRTSTRDDPVIPAIGTTAFLGAGVLLLAGGLTNSYTQVEWGQGLWFADAAAALLAGAAYAVLLLRRVRTA